MTVDVEDYFQVSAFERVVRREDWLTYESRVCANTDRVLDLFAESGVRATFFILGWVAERYPALVRRIANGGHDVASHSHWHRLVYDLTPDEFRDDLRRAKDAIESASGTRVRGFRAPSFSVTARSLWALDVLVEEGYEYDASVFPIHHDRYGIPGAPLRPFRIVRNGTSLVEVPGTKVTLGATSIPVGGGYFRLFPYHLTRWAVARLNHREARVAVVYFHPWELDPAQPRLSAPLLSRARHYNQLGRTRGRLARLVRDFRFGSIETVVLPAAADLPAVAPTRLAH
jgi:polysaccharide deacetylase family protein (PEP-CTERM system associated)